MFRPCPRCGDFYVREKGPCIRCKTGVGFGSTEESPTGESRPQAGPSDSPESGGRQPSSTPESSAVEWTDLAADSYRERREERLQREADRADFARHE